MRKKDQGLRQHIAKERSRICKTAADSLLRGSGEETDEQLEREQAFIRILGEHGSWFSMKRLGQVLDEDMQMFWTALKCVVPPMRNLRPAEQFLALAVQHEATAKVAKPIALEVLDHWMRASSPAKLLAASHSPVCRAGIWYLLSKEERCAVALELAASGAPEPALLEGITMLWHYRFASSATTIGELIQWRKTLEAATQSRTLAAQQAGRAGAIVFPEAPEFSRWRGPAGMKQAGLSAVPYQLMLELLMMLDTGVLPWQVRVQRVPAFGFNYPWSSAAQGLAGRS